MTSLSWYATTRSTELKQPCAACVLFVIDDNAPKKRATYLYSTRASRERYTPAVRSAAQLVALSFPIIQKSAKTEASSASMPATPLDRRVDDTMSTELNLLLTAVWRERNDLIIVENGSKAIFKVSIFRTERREMLSRWSLLLAALVAASYLGVCTGKFISSARASGRACRSTTGPPPHCPYRRKPMEP